MSIQQNPYPLRINNDLMEKLKIVASQNGRSVNKEIEQIISQYLKDWETANGEITLDSISKNSR